MREIHRNYIQLADDLVLLTVAYGAIFIALKFPMYFNNWVYFPLWPNIGDSAVLIAAVLYFVWRIKRRR